MRFARLVYLLAGIWGMLVIPPLFFMPPTGDPVTYFGFAVVGLAWQVAFLLIARNPERLRPLMPATWIEKFGFAAAVFLLRPGMPMTAFAAIDLALGVLFVAAWRYSGRAA